MNTGPEHSTDSSTALSAGEVTRLLRRWRRGDEQAPEALFEVVYTDLRDLAERFMRRERSGHTLPPTGLVHETFLRLSTQDASLQAARNRRHFLGIAANAMRRILVDHARYLAAAKRPSSRDAEPLTPGLADPDAALEHSVLEVLAVNRALDDLRDLHPRRADVVELRYFAGLEESEVAELLGVSRATVTRDWRIARLLLQQQLVAPPSLTTGDSTAR